MAEEEGGKSADTDRKATENVLTQKFGPLPLFVWVALGAGLLGAFILLKKKGGTAGGATPVATGISGGQSGGGSGGTADTSGFVSSSQETTDIATVGKQITDLTKSMTDQLTAIQGNETALGTGIANTNTTLTQTQAGLSSLGTTVGGLNSGYTGPTGASQADLAALASEIQALTGSAAFAGQSSIAAIGQNAGNIASRNSGTAVSSGTSHVPGVQISVSGPGTDAATRAANPGQQQPGKVYAPGTLVGADAATIAANPGRR